MPKEKTINMNVGFIKEDYKDINLDYFAKRWKSHVNELHKLCWCDDSKASKGNYEKLLRIKKLVDQMIEVAFNDEYEKQQKKKEAV